MTTTARAAQPAPRRASAPPRRAPAWFERAFGEEYLALYPHRDDAEAATAAALVERHVTLDPGAPVLDLACGAGRHVRALAARWWTVGLDLSPTLLAAGRARAAALPFVRSDMRHLPFRAGAFGLVVNLFTSFGYFAADRDHRRVLAEVARVTRTSGWLVLDYLNAPRVRATLVPHDERRVGSRVVVQRRSISPDGRYVRKTISAGRGGPRLTERVRLFEPAELAAMLDGAGFTVRELLGDYAGGAWGSASPRAILVARRR